MRLYVAQLLICTFFTLAAAEASGSTATSTMLSVSPGGPLVAGMVATLTATVTASPAVTSGTVKFCNALKQSCVRGGGLYAATQLRSDGTAMVRLHLGVGITDIKAVFVATTSAAGSTSGTIPVRVTPSPIYTSAVTLSSSGSSAGYSLTGSVFGFGDQPLTQAVTIVDSSVGNINIRSAPLSSSRQTFALTTMPSSGLNEGAATGDFNGDGIPDLAVANYAGKVAIMLGNGDGTFHSGVDYAVGEGAWSVAVADFNGDGIPDLVVSNTVPGGSVSILLGNGDGTFQSQSVVPTGGNPYGLAFGDFNGDGTLDLAVANWANESVSILIGNGDGTFHALRSLVVEGNPYSIVAEDFNRDGVLDLAATNSDGGTVSIMLGNGDGTFQAARMFDMGAGPQSLSASDFNEDGIIDLAAANPSTGTVSVLLGLGDGTFQSPVSYTTNGTSTSLLVQDVNGDGLSDLALVDPISDSISVLLGNGDGTFQSPVMYATGSGAGPRWLVGGDFNGDGLSDVITGNLESISIFSGERVATYVANQIAFPPATGSHRILASFPGDTSRTPSESVAIALEAPLGTPLISIGANANPVQLGSPVELFSVLVGVDNVNPTGAIAFYDAGVLIGSGTVSGTTAVFPTSVLTIGTHPISAIYAGDSNYSGAMSSVLSETVSARSSAVALASSQNPSIFGSTVTLTATVTSGATGTVSFKDGTALIGTASVSGTTAVVATAKLGVGLHSISAYYSGDSSYGASTSIAIPQTVYKAPATLAVSSSMNPSVFGQSVTFSAVVSSGATGAIAFYDAGVLIGSGTVSGTTAVFPTSVLTIGTHPISAIYAGDSNYSGAMSSVLSETVSARSSAVTLASSQNASIFGSTVTLTATVTSGATGTVSFKDGTALIGTALVSGTTAVMATAKLGVGLHSISAYYSGDSSYGASTSIAIPQTVYKAPATLAVSSSMNPSVFGQSVTFSAVVSSGATGIITFHDGATVIGIAPISGTTAQLTTSTLGGGPHSLVASFEGDDSYGPSRSVAILQVVNRAAVALSVSSSPDPSIYGQNVLIIASVTPGATGAVTFSDGAAELGVAAIDPAGVASVQIKWLSAGSHDIVAVYSGDANYF